MIINNRAYDILKWVAQILLPAVASLYFGLSQLWGLPYAEEIVGTITVCDAFLGALLGISNYNYVYNEVSAMGKGDESEVE